MRKALRLFVGLLLVFALGAFTADRRSRAVRHGYAIRSLMDARARMTNEIEFLRGSVLRLASTRELLARARDMGLEVGRRWGREVKAPAIAAADGQ